MIRALTKPKLTLAERRAKALAIRTAAGHIHAAQRAVARAPWSDLSDAQKIADLEQRLAVFEAYFKFGVSEDGLIPWCETQGRFGVMTRWWSLLKWGFGCAFSVGTITDWCGVYSEVEDITNRERPSTPFFGWLKVRNRKQHNVGIELHVANQEPGQPAIVMLADGNAILVGGASAFYIGKTDVDAKQLWP